MAKIASSATIGSVEITTWYSPVIARFDQQTLSCCGLLLLCNHCVYCGLRLLLMRQLKCSKGLCFLNFVFSLDPINFVLGHLQQLVVRHGRIVAQKIHNLLSLT